MRGSARAERTAAIEDSSNGIRSAHAAGMRVIALPNTHYPPAAGRARARCRGPRVSRRAVRRSRPRLALSRQVGLKTGGRGSRLLGRSNGRLCHQSSVPGEVVAGFRITSLIGQGAVGSVYLGEDLKDGTRAALKLLGDEAAQDERFRQRFLRESELAASLDHPTSSPRSRPVRTEVASTWRWSTSKALISARCCEVTGPRPVACAGCRRPDRGRTRRSARSRSRPPRREARQRARSPNGMVVSMSTCTISVLLGTSRR